MNILMDELLASIFRNQWLVITIVGLLLLALAEVGFRAGLRLFAAKDERRKVQIGGVQGAVLGMLPLLLGTGFSNVLLPLLIAVVITLISDLDHPRRGLVGISQQPLLDLKQSLQSLQPGQK
jgi:hypothetical protein